MKFINSKYIYFLPLIGWIPWAGMLIALMVCWSVQGKPSYAFMDRAQTPVYISDIAATNLQPIFIVGSSLQAIFFLATLIVEFILRNRLNKWFSIHAKRLSYPSFIFMFAGQIGIILVSCFNTKNFPHLHLDFLSLFILGILLHLIMTIIQYLIMGLKYDQSSYWNYLTFSFYLKLIFLLIAGSFAACFKLISNDNTNASFEWSLSFFYITLFWIYGFDLYKLSREIPDIAEVNEQDKYSVNLA
ncbi:hypothetical protein WICMUC_000798 [Wickerhamomyces mucosus]|uniref:CWH43-like N-terminal domain-containing protein n=1 Tax=Wickerhamomyces mucosus TaxID=1378264 RepID=A0A9P8PWK9_9ASCO|nr:hypothetical protein WICMUC_000798 [Wickerhamomyces mucosus]